MAKKEAAEKTTLAELKKQNIELQNEKEKSTTDKVNDLLKDLPLPKDVKLSLGIVDDDLLPLDDEKPVDLLELNKKTKSDDWVLNELDRVTLELERVTLELERVNKELLKSKDEYTKLFNSFNGINNLGNNNLTNEYQQKIRSIFTELESNFLGLNPQKTKYTDVKIQRILDKLVENFPFLMQGR